MATISKVWLIVQNTSQTDHGSNDKLQLTFAIPGTDPQLSTSHGPSADGGAYQFEWDVTIDSDDVSEITLAIEGNDAWLPASIWVLVEADGEYSIAIAQPNWSSDNWFSTDPSDGGGKAHAKYNLKTAQPT